MYLLPLSLSLIALSSGCALTPESMIRSQLDEAVARAESMAVTDSGDRSDCKASPKTWRAPIHSLTQDIRVRRCETVYYYFATYAQFVGDAYPIAFAPSIAFVGYEDLLTGKKRMAD
ncbi:hypothetical protein A9975_14445 [Cupriavidus sp. UME77]|nr:hypothetical protein [Cupriavidus sp. UME77]